MTLKPRRISSKMFFPSKMYFLFTLFGNEAGADWGDTPSISLWALEGHNHHHHHHHHHHHNSSFWAKELKVELELLEIPSSYIRLSVLQFILNCFLCAMFMHIAAGEHIAQRYCVEFIVLGPDSDDDARHQALQLSSFTPLPAIIPFCSHLHLQHHQHHLLHHPHQGIIRYSLTQHPSLLSPVLMM